MSDGREVANKVLAQEREDRLALKALLDRELSRDDRLLVERVEMGGTESYIGSVTLEWLAGKVGFAGQLPLFQQKIDPKTFRLQIDAETVDFILQRPLDWSRQAVLTRYLAVQPVHKFPPVLVVMTRDWVDTPRANEWDRDHQAVRSVADYIPLDSKGRLGLLDVSEVQLFALDGQHRLMGIQGLIELLKTGRLLGWNGDKTKEVGEALTLLDMQEEHELSASYLQALRKEKIGIEVISAVTRGETREEAKRRVKSIFVHVNTHAAPLSAGQLGLLNEDDGFSVVARRVAVVHPLLKKEEKRQRVNWNNSTMTSKQREFTTLQTLIDMAQGYLTTRFPDWLPSDKRFIPTRPSDEELKAGEGLFAELLAELAALPSIAAFDGGEEAGNFRRFSWEGEGGGQGHMLYRPIGQQALAAALGQLHHAQGKPLGDLFTKLRAYDAAGGFKMESEASPWYMVLYDPNKKRILVRGEKLAVRLLVYLLGGTPNELDQEKLRAKLAEERSIDDKAMGYDGVWTTKDDIKLPPLL